MIRYEVEAHSIEDLRRQLAADMKSFTTEIDDRLIERMRNAGFAPSTIAAVEAGPRLATAAEIAQLPAAAAAAGFPIGIIVPVETITGTDDDAQIELPLDDKPKRKRRTKAEIEAENNLAHAAAERARAIHRAMGDAVDEIVTQTTQPEVVDNTGSEQPLISPAADDAGAGEVMDAGRGTSSPVVEISPEAFRAKLQNAISNGVDVRAVEAVLNEFGYTQVKKVEAEKYAAIMARADQLVADKGAS
jgi:hypothetical protein